MSDEIKEFNPFQTPAARLDTPAPAAAETLFFTASPRKFAIMSIATFSLYCLYWFYKNWQAIRARTGRSIMAFWRAFFAVIWAYGCFKEIASASAGDASRTSPSVGLALLYLLLNLASRLPDPFWLVSLGTFIPVMVANGWAREANQRVDPDRVENTSFSGWNWVAIILGFALLALSLVGAFLIEPQ